MQLVSIGAKGSNVNRCDVVMLVDEETGSYVSGVFVPERLSMEEKIFRALQPHYRSLCVVPFGPDIAATLLRLRQLKPRMVFNLTEWFAGDRTQDQAIAGVLELAGLRYTGTGPAGMQLCRDKRLTKQLAAAAGVDVPRAMSLQDALRMRDDHNNFPLMVKPCHGDGSEGIDRKSLVRSALQLRQRVQYVQSRYGAVMCEEYIPGHDIYVGILGNRPQVLAPTEMIIENAKPSAPQFATARVKDDGVYRAKWGVRYRLAKLPKNVVATLRNYSIKTFRALKLRDYARLDFRLTESGRVVLIEANPNPDLTPHTLGHNLCFVGVEYSRLIPQIIEIAQRRYASGKRRAR